MRVLIVHHRYFVSGGPERYLFNVTSLLQRGGHVVIPFSVAHRRNAPTPYADYFLSPLGSGDPVYFHEISKTPRNLVRLLGRSYYSVEAARRVLRLVRDHRIDVAYLLGYLRWMSPSVIHALARENVPIVARLSDFQLVCPQLHFLRAGRPCELCKTGKLRHAMRYRCVRGSLGATAVDVSARILHRWLRSHDRIRSFVAPSRFLRQKMIEAGYAPERLRYVPTFVPSRDITPEFRPGSYVLYHGRLAVEKGLDVLLSAWDRVGRSHWNPAGLELRIIGIPNRGERERLEQRVVGEGITRVRFGAPLTGTELADTIRQARCTVTPSICYENLPNAVLESFAYGKTAIASAIGGIPELVRDGETGWLAPPRDVDALSKRLAQALAHPEELERLGRAGRRLVEDEYSPERHYRSLLEVFAGNREVGLTEEAAP